MIYEFKVNTIEGESISLDKYKGKVMLIVNTASRCGFTYQFKDLEALYQKYHNDLAILGFPCNQFANEEPLNGKDIKEFCSLNYNVTFDIFDKINVNGSAEHPLYTYLKSKKKGFLGKNIKWNFTKFLIDRNGNVIKRYSPNTNPIKIEKDILRLI
jgi:glutathione peroxidase